MQNQLKEKEETQEVLKDQLVEKERSYQKLEMEVVDLRKEVEKNEAHAKFKNNSTILGKILDCQRSPFDKTRLGYNKEIKKSEADTWALKKSKMNPASSKDESKATP